MTIMLSALRTIPRTNPTCTATYHGTQSAYNHARCRCDEANEENRLRRKRHRTGHAIPALVDATGTGRRIQALAAIGWTFPHIAEPLGVKWQFIQQLAHTAKPRVFRATADAVKALYRDLSGRPGPSNRSRCRALARGWLGPMAWHNIDDPNEQPDLTQPEPETSTVDLVLVDEVLRGHARIGQLNDAEKVALWQAWLRRRVEFGHDRIGLRDFTAEHGITYKAAVALRWAAEGGHPNSNTQIKIPTTAASECRTNERKAA